MQTILRIFSYLGKYPKLATAQLVCAILMTLMLLVFPMMTGRIKREVIDGGEIEKLWPYVAVVVVAFFLRDFFNCLRILINNIFEQKAIYDLRSSLYNKLQRLRLKWFDERRTGDIMTRVAEDVPQMERVLIDGIEQGLIALLQVLIVTIFPIHPLPHPRGQCTGTITLTHHRSVAIYTSRRQTLPDCPQSHWRNECHASR